MRIIRGREIVDDSWRHLDDDEALPPEGDIIVSLARWQTERDQLLARKGGLGLRLAADQSPDAVAGDLGHFATVALDFPVFRDGRAFTHARHLRQKHNYEGELRAVGDVLRDQLLFMHRCGFDAMELRPDRDIEDALEAFSELPLTYQRAAGQPPT